MQPSLCRVRSSSRPDITKALKWALRSQALFVGACNVEEIWPRDAAEHSRYDPGYFQRGRGRELIKGNPATRLGKKAFAGARKRAIDFLTSAEASTFLAAARVHSPGRYPMFLTALRTGLRLGELIALHWEDIQFGENPKDSNRFILVRRNYTRGACTTPKNHKARRVDMSKEVRLELIKLRDEMTVAAFERGEERIPKLVFPSSIGGPLDGVNVYHRDFLPCLTTAGLRRITFHAFRHATPRI